MLPPDSHVHSEWSWDASHGSMEGTCARAVAIDLPVIAFLQRCRERFPDLRILSGVELGEPHWHAAAVAALLGAGQFDRVLGSLHCLPAGGQFSEMASLFRQRPAAGVVREYLPEIPHLIEGSDAFSVLAHIDYPLRYWPAEAGPFDPGALEKEFRHALRVLAGTGRALEINTSRPLGPEIVRWWHDEGGRAVTFGSDAHRPEYLARGFRHAAAMAEASGFRPGSSPYDPWPRAWIRPPSWSAIVR